LAATPRVQAQLAAGHIDLAEQHLPDLWYVAQWLADDLSAAEALVRDTLYAGLRQYGDLRGEAETRSWLFKLMYEAYHAGPNEGAARSGGAPAGTASGNGLGRALRSLPVWLRTPILLSDVAGLSYGEIARALRLPVGAVRARIAEGRSQLVPLVESTCPAFGPAHDGSGKRGVGHVGPHADRARGSG
jgi:RNA polymerase sigma-70 factor (ECF subfamily)